MFESREVEARSYARYHPVEHTAWRHDVGSGLGMDHTLFRQIGKCLVIVKDDPAPLILDNPAMTMGGIFAKTLIRNQKNF